MAGFFQSLILPEPLSLVAYCAANGRFGFAEWFLFRLVCDWLRLFPAVCSFLKFVICDYAEHSFPSWKFVEYRPSSEFAFLSYGRLAVRLVVVCAASRGLAYVLSWRRESYCRDEFLTFR